MRLRSSRGNMEEAICIKSDVEEEYFSDCTLDEMKIENDVTYTSDYVKFEEVAIKCEPFETVSRMVVKEEGLQHTQIKKDIKDECFPDFENGNFQIATERNEANGINTCDGIKCEVVDIKYESPDDVGLSSTENEETSVTCNQTCDKITKFSDDKLKQLNLMDGNTPGSGSEMNVEENLTADLRYLCTHTSVYKCDSCSYETRRKSDLRDHVLVHMDPSKTAKYECSTCSFKTRRKSNLQEHMFIHMDRSKILKYACSVCPYKARKNSMLQQHMLVHTDPSRRPKYECYICGYTTPRKSNLQSHMSVHMDLKYECNVCSYKARRKYNLQRHILSHTGPSEKFECNTCPYKTWFKANLQRHMLVHTDSSKSVMDE